MKFSSIENNLFKSFVFDILLIKLPFLKSNGDIGAEAMIGLVVVRKTNESIKLVRELPVQIKNILLMLEEGPKMLRN